MFLPVSNFVTKSMHEARRPARGIPNEDAAGVALKRRSPRSKLSRQRSSRADRVKRVMNRAGGCPSRQLLGRGTSWLAGPVRGGGSFHEGG